jgi:hypothetical protein
MEIDRGAGGLPVLAPVMASGTAGDDFNVFVSWTCN